MKSTSGKAVNPIPTAPPLTTATIGLKLEFRAVRKAFILSKMPTRAISLFSSLEFAPEDANRERSCPLL